MKPCYLFGAPVALSLVLSGCVATTAIETKHLPTVTEAQAQLQADLLALKVAGCIAEDLSAAASPIVAASVDSKGQRIAAAIYQSSGKVCGVPVAPIDAAR